MLYKGPQRFRAGRGTRWGPHVGGLATTPMPSEGSPTLQRGGQKKAAGVENWVDSLHSPCRLGGSQHFTAGDKIRTGPQVGESATSSVLSGGSPTLQSRRGIQRWPTSGRIGSCHLGGPQPFRARDKIRNGPHVSRLAISRMTPQGSPTLQSLGQNQKWPTNRPIHYITLAV